jgi:anti-anti-sigma factor
MATAPELDERAAQLCGDGPCRLVLDLRELRFIDSTGLLAIRRMRELCADSGCELQLIPGPPAVQRLFELTGLLERLPFGGPATSRGERST